MEKYVHEPPKGLFPGLKGLEHAPFLFQDLFPGLLNGISRICDNMAMGRKDTGWIARTATMPWKKGKSLYPAANAMIPKVKTPSSDRTPFITSASAAMKTPTPVP